MAQEKGKELKMKGTRVLQKNSEATTRFVVNQGGRGSSKTYSILQLLLGIALREQNIKITVVRKTLPSAKDSVIADFFNKILIPNGLYDINNHNKTDNSYLFPQSGSRIEFKGIASEDRIKGAHRDYLYINEANELSYDEFEALKTRTNTRIFFDFNPSFEFSWIYDFLNQEKDLTFIKSTYLDNPYLPESIVKDLEKYKDTDENKWRIYGLGEKGSSKFNIYTNYEVVDSIPEDLDFIYGIDSGYTDPTAVVQIYYWDNKIYLEELLYKPHLTHEDVIRELMAIDLDKNKEIYYDVADARLGEELRRAGYNVKKSDKSVKDGIDAVKSKQMNILSTSINLLKEIRTYRWKTHASGNTIEEPIKSHDHCLDALRYAIYNHFKSNGTFDYEFSFL